MEPSACVARGSYITCNYAPSFPDLCRFIHHEHLPGCGTEQMGVVKGHRCRLKESILVRRYSVSWLGLVTLEVPEFLWIKRGTHRRNAHVFTFPFREKKCPPVLRSAHQCNNWKMVKYC